MILKDKILIGWKEWVCMPGIGIPAIKAKIDTGARTSALHAYMLETFYAGPQLRVRFSIHPLQKRTDLFISCEADIVDYRKVSDSGGHAEMRYVISTPIHIGNVFFNSEITLTNRESMKFRMLLGRTAMAGRFRVDPAASYMIGRNLKNAYPKKNKRKSK